MEEEQPTCPECGYPLTGRFLKNRSGKISIEFWCDQAGEDKFRFQILTGITDEDIGQLVIGKPIHKEMSVKLLERMSEEEAIESYEMDSKKSSE
jgi:hypothetical protein